MHTLVCFILLFIAPVISGYFTGLEPPKKDETELLSSLTFHVSRKIVNISEIKLLYVVEIDSYPRFSEFIHALHETSIQTVSISHHSKITSSMDIDQPKNIIFTLDDVSESLDLIFYTSTRGRPIGKEEKLIQIPISDRNRNAYRPEILPRCCIKVDGRYLWLTAAGRKKCSMEVSLTSRELSDHSILSDQVFNVTRGLFLNNIWNFKNYIIFLVKSFGHITKRSALRASHNTTLEHSGADMTGTLIFCFKFFWRFFKGFKAVICHPHGCERYDPFTENLISFQDWEGADEAFFDFSWRNMHKKNLTVVADMPKGMDYGISYNPSSLGWYFFLRTVLEHFASSVNCTLREGSFLDHAHSEINDALKYGFDMVMFQSGLVAEGSEFSRIDFTVGFDTGALGIFTPHSGYMSQGLVIFKSFSPVVWVFISATILLLCFALHTFQLSQHELFNRLYTYAENDYYRNASSLLTLCAYFLCGSPPSLHLGHLCTGKILFLIFSFSALIISTAFLGSMTTLLSDRVMYPEIDSLKSLEESNLIIQTDIYDRLEITSLFQQLNQSETLRAKITDSFMYYIDYMGTNVFGSKKVYGSVASNVSHPKTRAAILQEVFGDLFEVAKENIRAMMETDAFLMSLPDSARKTDNIRMRHDFVDQGGEFHLVQECLMTYPMIGVFLKNSFYFEKYNQLITRYFESGHAEWIFKVREDLFYIQGLEASTLVTNKGPRPFSLNDLQSAFIGLIVGLFLSFLAFVGEIAMDFFQDSAAVKFLMRFKK